MELPKEYILPDFNIRTLHIYDLLKHTANADFMAVKEFQDISPVALELNAGVFTKSSSLSDFPRVAVSQVGSNLVTSCSCNSAEDKLCIHQAEIIHCLLEEKDYRIFFDAYLRHKTLLPYAKSYGLEEEGNLDIYFRLDYLNGRLQVSPKIKELLQVDEHILKRDLLPRRTSIIKDLATQDTNKKQILVIGKHRYYNQLNFQLMEADTTQTGKLKNPINSIDVMKLLWKAEQASEIKFYTAITSFNNQYGETDPAEAEALRHIVQNPLNLEVYLHDRTIAESISAKSLVPVNLNTLQAEIQLHVFWKEPFYEITGELLFRDTTLPFSQVVIRNEYFVYYRNTYYLITDPDMLRVIQFFKSNNEILLVHSSRYEVFMQSILTQLEQRVQINYSYIRQATPTEIADKDYTTEKLIYLHQEGNYISITPVMKYGNVEIPVYSRKQLLDTDQNGNEFKIERDHNAEIRLTRVIMEQHSDFKEQIEEQEYFYLHKDKFLDDEWFLNAFETWRNEDINILGFNNIKNNKLNAHRAKITIEVTSGIDWFNAQLKVGFGHKKATLKQVNKAIRNKSKFVQLDDGTLGILPEEWIHKIAHYFQAGDIDEELLKIPKVNYTEIQDLFEKEVLSEEVQAEVASYTHNFSANAEIPEVAVPETLNAELRAYQREGLNWLNFLDSHNFGGCLADDMGLGKTVQIIAFILSQREKHGHTTNLVVLPTSLLFNWQEELAKFAPSVKVLTHYGTDRQKSTADFQKYEVVLTTYGMLLSDITFLKKFRFNYIFLDESQTIKNPNSERYKAARLLQARNRIALTGTPVENNTFDLYGQLSFACPGLLGSKQYFKDIYAIPIDKFEYSKRAIELQKKIKPFILRRTKKQVATELPEKTEMLIYCEMNTEQRRIYDLYEKEVRDFISATDEDEIHNKSMHVLTGLTRLRQICNSPVLLKDGHSGDHAVKIEILTEQIENKSKEHKILVFSQFVEMLDLIKAKLDEKSIRYEYLTGQTQNRGAKVQHFQNNEEVRVFLISLKAGGTGLNLTEADYVYLVDPWWNPAVENQAIDRSYRIGQTKNVVAVRMICSGTIEEKMMNLQKKKKKLAQDLITTENSFFSSLSKDDLLSIL
ncbi:DNA helicase [Elizabethkingia miricola]|uniref:DNA helicase n=1 Tax=Elizabethkingia miricola TaxID=172045 RepID=A0ABD4DQ00_ELIMR|nr:MULTISPECIES: DEAD/DEAH box helicase [Elizabethkingia]KUY20590.1 DNA helicase [Elizabethkingia miricola]MCL1653223.1 DEAD/DEAH box helicase [Elizabethkingia miricola]OPC70413.1 DNA helicase [Elizabethkingia miricola]OPC74342.1 DNA helicase [Elizabethkingia miricola]QCO45170.1 DEAD/DEAH box helicase [Elizabethkingia sp. 2-6]